MLRPQEEFNHAHKIQLCACPCSEQNGHRCDTSARKRKTARSLFLSVLVVSCSIGSRFQAVDAYIGDLQCVCAGVEAQQPFKISVFSLSLVLLYFFLWIAFQIPMCIWLALGNCNLSHLIFTFPG